MVEQMWENKCKHVEFAADVAMQHPGWAVKIVMVIVATLGFLGTLRKHLASTTLFTKQQVNANTKC